MACVHTTGFKTSFDYDRLQSLWIRVLAKKGSQRASARFRALFTSGLDQRLFARSRHKTGLEANCKKRRARGFTLMELLLVITIISVLTAIIAPQFFGQSQEARITAAKQMIAGSFSLGLTRFELDNGRYPTTEEGLEALVVNPQTVNWQGPYIQSVTIPLDPWGNPYDYRYPSEFASSEAFFDVVSAGPDGTLGNEDDVTNHNLAENRNANRNG